MSYFSTPKSTRSGQGKLTPETDQNFDTPALAWLGLPLAKYKEFSFELDPEGGQLWATGWGTYHTRTRLKYLEFGWKPSEIGLRIPPISISGKATANQSLSLSLSEAGGR